LDIYLTWTVSISVHSSNFKPMKTPKTIKLCIKKWFNPPPKSKSNKPTGVAFFNPGLKSLSQQHCDNSQSLKHIIHASP